MVKLRMHSHHPNVSLDLIADQELIERLREQQFDIGMSELYECCGEGFFEIVGIRKQIRLSAMYNQFVYQAVGLPMAPSYIPRK